MNPTTIAKTDPTTVERTVRRLLQRLGHTDISVCVQAAISVLAARTGRPEFADCIDDGRVSAVGAGDEDLIGLLKLVLEEMDRAVHTGRGCSLAA